MTEFIDNRFSGENFTESDFTENLTVDMVRGVEFILESLVFVFVVNS